MRQVRPVLDIRRGAGTGELLSGARPKAAFYWESV